MHSCLNGIIGNMDRARKVYYYHLIRPRGTCAINNIDKHLFEFSGDHTFESIAFYLTIQANKFLF